MPLYEYACAQCGHRFEVRQGIREEPLTICSPCGGPIRRVIQPVGIVFKGSGFYKTDSRTTGGAGASTAERAESAAPAAPNGKAEGESAAPATPAPSPNPA